MVYIRIRLFLVLTKNLKKIHRPEAEILARKVGKYEKSRSTTRSTRSHLTHARSVHALNRVPTRAKPPAFHPDVFSVKKRDFPLDRFTGYKKSNQRSVNESFTVRVRINVVQDLSHAPLQCSLTRAC